MSWQIVRVPEKAPSSMALSTVNVLAAVIDPKMANSLVRQLNKVCPLENLRHVKRVRKTSIEGKVELSVILCICHEPENTEGIPDEVIKFASTYSLSPYKAKVAKCAAISRKEWEEQCKLWPTSYHPSTNCPRYFNNILHHECKMCYMMLVVHCCNSNFSGFDEVESQLIINYMRFAIGLARTPDGKVVNAAVIVDPSNEQTVATAKDQTFNGFATCETSSNCSNYGERSSSTACQPVTMENHLGNSAECSELKFLQHDLSSVSCLYPWQWIKQQLDCSNSEEKCGQSFLCHPLRHAVLVAIENAAARDRRLFPSVESQKNLPPLSAYVCGSSDSLPSKRQKMQISEILEMMAKDGEMPSSEATRPYLCTGFDAFIVWEPCAMCAMALVHQRVRRVFYAFPNQNAGALGSVYRLQGEKSLNHHYSVFRVLTDEENLERNEWQFSSCSHDK